MWTEKQCTQRLLLNISKCCAGNNQLDLRKRYPPPELLQDPLWSFIWVSHLKHIKAVVSINLSWNHWQQQHVNKSILSHPCSMSLQIYLIVPIELYLLLQCVLCDKSRPTEDRWGPVMWPTSMFWFTTRGALAQTRDRCKHSQLLHGVDQLWIDQMISLRSVAGLKVLLWLETKMTPLNKWILHPKKLYVAQLLSRVPWEKNSARPKVCSCQLLLTVEA